MKIKNIVTTIISSIAFLATTSSLSAAAFAERSVLSEGSWKKISVKETGVCKLTYDQLKKMGFSNPSQVRIYGYGGAQLSEKLNDPKIDDLNATPLYDSGNALYFYAQGPRIWEYTSSKKGTSFTLCSNLYSLNGYYFLTENTGKREIISYDEDDNMSSEGTDELEETDVFSYMEHYAIKDETYNIIHSGKCWLGNAISNGQTKNFNLNIPDIDTDEVATLYASLAAYSQNLTSCDISIGGLNTKTSFSISSSEVKADHQKTIFSFVPERDPNSVSITFNGKADDNTLWIEQIVLNVYRKLKIHDGIMYFRDPRTKTEEICTYNLSGATKDVIVWNITDPQHITLVPSKIENGGLKFKRSPKGVMEEFVAFDPTSTEFVKAEFTENVNNQNLHAYSGYDLIIISPSEFISEAQRLADIHTAYDGLSVLVVTPEEIYNEFSSGTPDATAIRWFLKMFYDKGEKKKSILLFGDGCFDNRNIMKPIGTPRTNYIIAYEGGAFHDETISYVTDSYFCFLDSDDDKLPNGSKKMQYSIGRFPISSLKQATEMVNKVENYLFTPQFGDWRNKACLIADDNDQKENTKSTVNRFFNYSDKIADSIHSKDASMEIQKLYLDSYTRQASSNGSRYPEVEELFTKNIQDGTLIVNYIGHSSELAWASERVFTQNQAGSIFNEKQGFWFTASCEFTRFDNYASSGGEDLVLNPNGGALTLFSAARTVYDDKNDNLNRKYIDYLFSKSELNEPLTIGEICRKAKNELPNDSNKLSFNLLGDPALKLAIPEGNVETDSIILIGKGKTDTLKALSEAKIFGHIDDANGNYMDGFNGIVNITIYDKKTIVYTKGNLWEESEKAGNRHDYYDRLNILFSGKAEVINGRFNATLKIPKDINYNYGEGRIHYYAYDEENKYDADGSNETFIIGGSNDCELTDENGPDIRMYINQKSFLSGDKVNNKPVLYAEIHDENGINASGCGIGHDITLNIDGSKTPIILNKNLTYDIDSYSDGTIDYQMSELEPGYHTISLRVWDLLNNSTQKEISFFVDKELPIETHKMDISYAADKDVAIVTIMHDRAQSVASHKIIIYNSEGKVILETFQTTERLGKDLSWEWNYCGNNGNRVSNGLYIIRVEFETDEGDFYGLSQKILVNTRK